MMNQTKIAKYFRQKYGTKIDQARVSRMLSGYEPIPWPFANDLSMEFKYRTIQQWKNASPEELKRAFEQLPRALTNQTSPEAA